MQQSNKILLEERLALFLQSLGQNINIENSSFVLKIDITDEKILKTNMEQIINFWVLPKVLNKELRLRRAIDVLVGGTNEIPLWIKVDIENGKIILTICKRYRKIKEVELWHQNNPFAPFILNTNKKVENLQIKEFRFAYPAGMEESQKIFCNEFDEIRNIMDLGIIDFDKIDDLIWENVENENANILKINSKSYDDQFILIDLWNSDQINVMNLYFKTKGAISDFVHRSLYRWNDRVWLDGGPKPEILEINSLEYLQENGRNIVEFHDLKNE